MQLERVVGYQRSRDEVVEGLERERTTMRPVVACRLVRARGRRGAELGAAATLLAAGDVGSAPSPSRPCAHSPRVHAVPLVPRAKIAPPSVPDEFVVRKQLLTDLDDASGCRHRVRTGGIRQDHAARRLGSHLPRGRDGLGEPEDRYDNDPRRLWATVATAVAASPALPVGHRPRLPVAVAHRQAGYLAELIEALGRAGAPRSGHPR